jgi:hypothetical protein
MGKSEGGGGGITEVKSELSELKTAYPNSRITVLNCAWSPRPTGINRLDPGNKIWIRITKELVKHCLRMNFSYYGIGTCLERDLTIQDFYHQQRENAPELFWPHSPIILRKNHPIKMSTFQLDG